MKISQSKLARKLNVTQSYLSKVENCQFNNVNVEFIRNISTELKVNPIYVFLFFYNMGNSKRDKENNINKLRKYLEELYLEEGLSEEVLHLSQTLDKEIVKIQEK